MTSHPCLALRWTCIVRRWPVERKKTRLAALPRLPQRRRFERTTVVVWLSVYLCVGLCVAVCVWLCVWLCVCVAVCGCVWCCVVGYICVHAKL